MIEITNTKGGRKRYNEDIRCLQELAAAFTEIFKEANINFVLSGCQNNQEGYVWLNDKIRYVPASDKSCDYIICDDTDGASIPYYDNTEHVMCHNYGAAYSEVQTSTCIQKVNGDFPRLKDAILGLYGVLKDSDETQVVNSPVYFDNVKFSSLIIDGTTTVKSKNDGFQILTKNGNYRFRSDSPVVEKFNGDEIEWQINGSSGKILMPGFTGNNLTCKDITTESIKVGGKPIAEILAMSKFPKSVKNERLVCDNGKTVSEYPYISVRQDKERVVLLGTIENEYILGERNHFTIDFDALQNSTFGEIVSYSGTGTERLVLFKSVLRLPDSIDAPSGDRLPGTMLSSDESQEEAGLKQYISGNAQLMIGVDKHLYFLLKTGQTLQWKYSKSNSGSTGPYINFSFYVD